MPGHPEKPLAPVSPCIQLCRLDADGFCAGCLRTGDEIARWLSMTPAEQWRLIDELRERRNLRRPVQV